METMGTALWDLYENQKVKGLVGAMRQTLAKLEKSGQADSRWFNAMGELASQDKNFSLAARFFRQAIDEHDRPEYQLNLGNALFSLGNYKDAKKVLASYTTKYPEDIHGLVNLANCQLHLQELKEVKELCGQGLETHTAKSPLWNCLGQVAFMEGQFQKAWEYFDQAYSESPDYIDALFNRANQAYLLGKGDEALHDFEMCLRKDENYLAALLNLALIHLERGAWSLGKEKAHRALKLSSNSLEAQYLLGRLNLGSKDYRAARDNFRKALKENENHIPTLIALARLEIQAAEPEGGIHFLKRVIVQRDLSTEERIATLTLILELGEYNLCIQYMDKLPEDMLAPALTKIKIFALWKTGKIRLAIQILDGLLKTEGETAGNLTLLGQMLAQSGADNLAEIRYQRALELDPTSQGAASELARLYLLRGEGEKAIEIQKAQVELHPQDPDCHYNLACCLAKSGHYETCLYNLKLAIEYGFQDFEKIAADDDLQSIRQSKEYSLFSASAGLS